MPVEVGSRAPRPPLRVTAAPMAELAFSLFIAQKSAMTPGGASQPWLQALRSSRPEMLERIATFWATGSYHEWAELIVLAQRSGTLFSEPEQFLARLEQTAATPYHVPPLPSEEDDVQAFLQDRLDRLAGSAELRSRYVALIGELWEFLKPYWTGGLASVAAEMVASYEQRLSRVDDPREVLPRIHFARRAAHAALVARAVEAGEAAIVPLALSGVGIAFFALPGLLLVGVGPEAEKRHNRRREAAEKAAARFKLLGDPTRLSILASFCSSPYSISDLADFFDLSQPTVSVHVKALREAGLLEATKARGQTLYRSSWAKVEDLLAGALSEISTN